jgi:hypothetical protein
MADNPAKERTLSEAQFKKAQRATEGAKAMSEYNAERQAERAKTERLRALRLGKEATDKAAKPVGKTKKAPRTGKTGGAGARLKE